MSRDFTLYLNDEVLPTGEWIRVGAELPDSRYAESWAYITSSGMTARKVLSGSLSSSATYWLDDVTVSDQGWLGGS